MRRDFFTYQPQFKLLIMGNNRPNLRNVDDAMRRRFIMLPFENKPPTGSAVAGEAEIRVPAILRWAIEGCLDWQQNGLILSDRDRDATEEYLASQDAFGQWLAEACDVEPGNTYKTASGSELFSSWQGSLAESGKIPGRRKCSRGGCRSGIRQAEEQRCDALPLHPDPTGTALARGGRMSSEASTWEDPGRL